MFYYYGTLVYLWMETLVDLYVMRRQLKILNVSTERPAEYENLMTVPTFEKARLYSIEKTRFRIVKACYMAVWCTLSIVYGWSAANWRAASGIVNSMSLSSANNEVLVTVFFILLSNFIACAIDFPPSFYDALFIETTHGFNKQTVESYLNDVVSNFIIIQVIFIPIAAAAICIIKYSGAYFIVWLWFFVFIICLLGNMMFPSMIVDMDVEVNKLPEGKLRKDFETLAEFICFPVDNVFIYKGSRTSRHTNAYFAGIFDSKRIVIYDTLFERNATSATSGIIKGCTDEEVLAIICHEFGHWKLNHVLYRMIFMQSNMLITFAAFAKMMHNEKLFKAFGFIGDEKPLLVGLLLVSDFILAPFHTLVTIIFQVYCRGMEIAADSYAKELGYKDALKSALIKLHTDNLNFPLNDWMHYLLNDSHPSLIERIENLDN